MWIFEILGAVFSMFEDSKSGSNDGPREYSGSAGDEPCGDYAGRWTQNEINIQHNIDMGMAVKYDDD